MKNLTMLLINIVISMVLMFGVVMQVSAVVSDAWWLMNAPSGRYYKIFIGKWSPTDPTPTICGGQADWEHRECIVKIYAVSDTGTIYDTQRHYIKSPEKVMSIGDMLQQLSKIGFNVPHTAAVHVPLSFKAMCVFFGYSSRNISTGSESPDIEITPCAPVQSPPVHCEAKGSPTIDHKTLYDDQIDGAQASTDYNLVCDGYAVVTVKASRTDSYGVKLTSDGSLYSEIQINGKDATEGIDIVISDLWSNPLHITSTLRARGVVATGLFKGYSLITIEPF